MMANTSTISMSRFPLRIRSARTDSASVLLPALARSSTIHPKPKLNAQGTHYTREDGVKLCYFCRRDLQTHPRCRYCTAPIHRPNPKYPVEAQCRVRLHEKRVCEFCAKQRKIRQGNDG